METLRNLAPSSPSYPMFIPLFPIPRTPRSIPLSQTAPFCGYSKRFLTMSLFLLGPRSHLLILSSAATRSVEAFPGFLWAELGLLWAPIALRVDLSHVKIFYFFHSFVQFHLNRL